MLRAVACVRQRGGALAGGRLQIKAALRLVCATFLPGTRPARWATLDEHLVRVKAAISL